MVDHLLHFVFVSFNPASFLFSFFSLKDKVINVWCIFECLTSNDCVSVFLCLVQCSNYHWVCCVVVIIIVFGGGFGWSLLKRLHFFYLKRWLSRWQYSAQCLLCVCFSGQQCDWCSAHVCGFGASSAGNTFLPLECVLLFGQVFFFNLMSEMSQTREQE